MGELLARPVIRNFKISNSGWRITGMEIIPGNKVRQLSFINKKVS